MISYIRLILISMVLLIVFNPLIADNEGTKVLKDFSLSDYNGKEYALNDFKESKAIVVMFIATQCPVSNDYNERMAKVYADYKDKDVTFLGINSNKQENRSQNHIYNKSFRYSSIFLRKFSK